MRPAPSVSVVVPALDARETVLSALESALNQDVAVEVLVIDDGSQDGTPQTVSQLGDPRIRLLSTGTRRSGPSNARNVGLAAAEGAWVAVLDADDRFVPGRLSGILRSAAAVDADLVVDDVRIVRPGVTGEATLFSRRRYPIEDVRPLRLAEVAHHDLGLAQPVVRRSLLEEHAIRYRAHGRATEDFAFLIDCTSAARHPIALPDVGYIYMKQPNSVSGASSGFWLDSLSVTAELLRDHRGLDDASRRGLERRMKQAADRYHYLSAREAVSRSDHKAAGKRLLAHPGAAALASGAAVSALLSRLRRGAKR